MHKLSTNVQHSEELWNVRRLTQDHLGERAGLPHSYIGGFERGERNVSLDTLERVINALEVSHVEVFALSDFEADEDKHEALRAFLAYLSTRDTDEIRFLHKMSRDFLDFTDR